MPESGSHTRHPRLLPSSLQLNAFSDLVSIFPNVRRIIAQTHKISRSSTSPSSPFQLITTVRIPCTIFEHQVWRRPALPKGVKHHLPLSWTVVERQRLIITCQIKFHAPCVRNSLARIDTAHRSMIAIEVECTGFEINRDVIQYVANTQQTTQPVEEIALANHSSFFFLPDLYELDAGLDFRFITKIDLTRDRTQPSLVPSVSDALSLVPWGELPSLEILRISANTNSSIHQKTFTDSASSKDTIHELSRQRWRTMMTRRRRDYSDYSADKWPLDKWCDEVHDYYAPDHSRVYPKNVTGPLQALRQFDIIILVPPHGEIDVAGLRFSEMAESFISIGGPLCAYNLSFISYGRKRDQGSSDAFYLNQFVAPMLKSEVEMALARPVESVGWSKLED